MKIWVPWDMSKINTTYITSVWNWLQWRILKKTPTLYQRKSLRRKSPQNIHNQNVCYCLENRHNGNFDQRMTLIFISKRSSSISSWFRKWFQFLLLKKKYQMASHFIDVEKYGILQFELYCNGFKGVLFHQFILTLRWFAMLIRGVIITLGESLFSSLLWLGGIIFPWFIMTEGVTIWG